MDIENDAYVMPVVTFEISPLQLNGVLCVFMFVKHLSLSLPLFCHWIVCWRCFAIRASTDFAWVSTKETGWREKERERKKKRRWLASCPLFSHPWPGIWATGKSGLLSFSLYYIRDLSALLACHTHLHLIHFILSILWTILLLFSSLLRYLDPKKTPVIASVNYFHELCNIPQHLGQEELKKNRQVNCCNNQSF